MTTADLGAVPKTRTLAQRVVVLLAGAVVLSTVLTAGITAWIGVRHLDRLVETDIEDAFASVRHNLTVFDRVLLSVEQQWEDDIRRHLPDLSERLLAQGRDPASFTPAMLQSLANEHGFSELYLIDRGLRVQATSFEPDLYLDMSQFSPEYTAYLTGLIGAGKVAIDRISPSSITGTLKKYAYYSPRGADWIVNIDLTVKDLLESGDANDLGTYLYTDFVDGILTSNHSIRDVDLVLVSEVDRWSLLHQGRQVTPEIGARLFNGEDVRIDKGGLLTIFRPVELPSYMTQGLQIAAAVTLDISRDRNLRLTFLGIVAGSALLALLLGVYLTVWIQRRLVTDRVQAIVDGLEQAGDDRSSRLTVAGDDELAAIAGAVNTMIGRIGEQEQELADINRSLEQKIGVRTAKLKEAMAEAEQANRARTNFFAMMTHELRTPLNAIIGFAQLLAGLPKDKITEHRVRDNAATIEMAGQHLLSIINNILDMSKIEAGRYQLDVTDIDIGRTLEVTRDMLRPLLENGSIEMALKVDGAPLVAKADERSLRQIVVNLVSNAIKFSDAGSTVEVSAKRDGSDLILVVSDTGAGMNEAELETALEPFGQVHTESVLIRQEGSGLGLPTVKALTELHDGTLEIATEPGKGTRVTVTLPQ